MAFYDRVRPAVAEIADARLEASERRARPRGLLRIGAPTAFATRFVVPTIGALQDRLCEN
ncbi:LysR family transcriptional regulator [Mesorhizobium caraganae]|uniref:LysR family transcriptional regulator n=1 Tax=Mesorhizobium caraganae TaxID=483206 RepID=UPI00193AD1BB|nr:LysR family transcriptional regulator [Mesorhizobium caraganae]MBM2715808.1 LysR family transcriptional regulator [Mesorhizobium caraganae]